MNYSLCGNCKRLCDIDKLRDYLVPMWDKHRLFSKLEWRCAHKGKKYSPE